MDRTSGVVLPSPVPKSPPLIATHVRARIAVLGALFIALHIDIVWRLLRIWASEGDWSHGFLIPLLAIYFIREDRRAIAAAVPRTCWAGLFILIAAVAVYFAGLHPLRSDMVKGYAMVAGLAGLTLLMVGPGVMRYLWVPILLWVLAVKISPPIWEAVAWRMQLIAADASVGVLNLIGVEADLSITQITLRPDTPGEVSLNVAQACSGMRMLMAFITVGVAVAYMGRRPMWARVGLVAMTVPIAIAVNVGRVVTLSLLSLIDIKYAGGDFHIFIGMVMLIPGLLMFMGVGWVFERIGARGAEVQSHRGAGDPSGSLRLCDSAPLQLSSTRLMSRPFFAAAVVMLTAMIALTATTAAMDWHFIKRPAPLRQRLYLLPETMGPYTKSGERRMSAELADEIGAGEYIVWEMRDTRLAAKEPGGTILLYISYRTGWPDSTPHVSDRFALLGGARPNPREKMKTKDVYMMGDGPFPFGVSNYGRGQTPVAHLYVASDVVHIYPRSAAQWLGHPRLRSAWWCRVEVQAVGVTNPVEARPLMDRFIAEATPHLRAALPAEEALR